ncbi:hypothetical protein LLH03_09070 [bacterium]|nr:hypothetical protein [bacterium]
MSEIPQGQEGAKAAENREPLGDEAPQVESDAATPEQEEAPSPQVPSEETPSVESPASAPPQLPWEVTSLPASLGRPLTPEELPGEELPLEDTGSSGSVSRALLAALGLLALALLAVGAMTLKLWLDRSAAQSSLQAAVGAISATASPEYAGTVVPRLDPLRKAIEAGKFDEATSRLAHLADGVSGGSATGPSETAQGPLGVPGGLEGLASGVGKGGLKPEAAAAAQRAQDEIPPEVLKFFEAHRDLAQAFAQANMAGLELKKRGGNVDQLRRIRQGLVEAARLKDEAQVRRLLTQFRTEFEAQARKLSGQAQGPGRQRRAPAGQKRPTQSPRELVNLAQRVDGALRAAQAEGRDLREPMEILRTASAAGRAGRMQEAIRGYSRALAAIRKAPTLHGQPSLFQNPLVSMFLGLLQVEDQDLAGVLDSLRSVYTQAKTDLSTTVSASFKGALETLTKVGARRQAFGKRLQEIRGGKAQPVDRQKIEAEMRQRAEEVRGELGDLLSRVQQMKPEDFAANRNKLVDQILNVVFQRPTATPEKPVTQPAAGGPTPTKPAVTEGAAQAEQRVRDKLLQSAGPYLKVRSDPAQKELADRLQSIFSQARTLLSQGKYDEAERLADQGNELLKPAAGQGATTP